MTVSETVRTSKYKAIRWYDYITINIYWFALTSRSQVLTPLVIPLLVQQFVGEESKGSYVGIIRLWALMAAVLIQSLMGIMSDRSTSRYGRRRPFIVAGTIGEVLVFVAIGFIAGMQGITGFWVLFTVYVLSMLASNTAQAGTQGLIPDLVPQDLRGRFSAVKALLEIPIPLILVSFVIGNLVSAGNLWGALIALIAVVVVCMAIAMFVREDPLERAPFELDWRPFARLVMMTIAFTTIILAIGWLTRQLMALANSNTDGFVQVLTGLIGVVGITAAVALGVWASVRIGVGPEMKESRSFTWWVVNRLAFLVASTNLATFMLFFLQDRFPELAGENAAGPAAMVIMFVGVFILLAALPSGWLADKFGKKLVSGVSGAIAAIGALVVILVPNMAGVYIGASLVGVAVGAFYTSNWALGTELVPEKQAGRYLGISNLAGAGAGAIGAYIGGPIADSSGYVVLFSIYTVMFVLSIVALRFVRDPDKG